MLKQDLKTTEYNEYFSRYINKVTDNTDLSKGFEEDKNMVINFFSSIPEDKLEYRYQPEKWSIKEVLQHIIDTERIFMYRFLRIARNDKTALAGFDQNIYISPSQANNKSLEELIHEFTTTRLYSINLINSISENNLQNIGTASESQISARACAFVLLGHSIWHIEIIKERYL
ncbi:MULTISPECIES: DinB family protein [unclassified Tenacibaculum]|uniref:DinB family protein n=1 Tax=unclassified Tenacibaculum TaxID=2635139 RepID=UPI001F44ED70|nr:MULTISPECIES: DinB family protein [unclassified Tenacibaculum]MCF2873846.1 DinB family protein [Tenacibaculum sp. Cn5-1]MCF2936656.1 DinB family protein [Tenacibaculum sp. Cn5-34]MCG7512880.1 DinB family protein [Tenacibaculum sp. Cn5-46]